MADTFGDLVDKLCIANLRLWHIEDERREFSKTDPTGGEAKEKSRLLIAEQLLNQVSKVNKERNSLIDQVNASMAVLLDALNYKTSYVQLDFNDLLGTGKNKFYKGEDH